jgi:hypothetical protein
VHDQPVTFPFTAPDGVKFDDLDPHLLDLMLGVSTAGVGVFPISDIVAGRSFGIESGKQTQRTSSGSITEAVSLTFKFLGSGNASSSSSGGGSGSSGGTALCHVPALHGNTLTAAQRRLMTAGCRLGKTTYTSAAAHATQRVTAQSPKAGLSRPHGSPVNVTLGA